MRAAETPVDAFLKTYNSLYMNLQRVANEAAWAASTDVSEPHDAGRTAANTALAVFLGDRSIIEQARAFSSDKPSLQPVTARQLDKILLQAAEGPGTIPQVTMARVAAESRQSSMLDGYTFKLDGKPASANDIDDVLAALARSGGAAAGVGGVEGDRQAAQARHREPAEAAQPGRARDEALELLRAAGRRLRHDRRRDDEAARRLPRRHAPAVSQAARLGAREAGEALQAAGAEADPGALDQQPLVAGVGGVAEGAVDLDPLFKDKSPSGLSRPPRSSTSSMGFPTLPKSFWEKSDLYALPADSASATRTRTRPAGTSISTPTCAR